MERGEVEQRIIEQCVREKKPLPSSIQNAPELITGSEIYYIAFTELSSCRIMGMGEGPIPWTAIQKYAEVYDIKGELREDLFYCVRHMDLTYLKFKSERFEQERKKEAVNGGRRIHKKNSPAGKAGSRKHG